MKSSFDLAMERLGGEVKELTPTQKATIQDLESRYKAKEAEAELSKNARILKADQNNQEIEQIMSDYAVEMASISSKRENEKIKIRNNNV